MSSPKPLPVWDRTLKKLIQEFMTDSPATYESRPHRSFTNLLQSHPAYDRFVSMYQNTKMSARKIEPFIQRHQIDMNEFEPGPYRTYAAFFDRRFRPGVRTFPSQPDKLGAFAEARYFGWERLQAGQEFPIKGHSLSALDLFGNEVRARPFEGGPIILARLAPVDYHHLHYPDDGQTLEEAHLGKKLWAVNQYALQIHVAIADRPGCRFSWPAAARPAYRTACSGSTLRRSWSTGCSPSCSSPARCT
jgi:phosphatidylserine decarboxylase